MFRKHRKRKERRGKILFVSEISFMLGFGYNNSQEKSCIHEEGSLMRIWNPLECWIKEVSKLGVIFRKWVDNFPVGLDSSRAALSFLLEGVEATEACCREEEDENFVKNMGRKGREFSLEWSLMRLVSLFFVSSLPRRKKNIPQGKRLPWTMVISISVLFFCWDMQVSIVSVVYSQSELLQKEVFLVELVDSISMSKESMSHLKAVYFLRPTSENIQHLRRQFSSPRFGEYHLCKLYKCFLGELVICSKLFRIIWNFDLKPFLCFILLCSFFQHFKGYSDSYLSWFGWAGGCPASSGDLHSLILYCLLERFLCFLCFILMICSYFSIKLCF